MCTGSTPNFSRTPASFRTVLARRSTCTTRSPRDALREVLVGRPDADLVDARRPRRRSAPRRPARRRPRARPSARRRTPIAASASSSGSNCGSQGGIDALAGLVARPEVVAERLDHVVGRDADVRRAALDHLEHGVQHAGCRAERLAVALAAAPPAVEVAEQLVGAVEQVDDHRGPRMADRAGRRRRTPGRLPRPVRPRLAGRRRDAARAVPGRPQPGLTGRA